MSYKENINRAQSKIPCVALEENVCNYDSFSSSISANKIFLIISDNFN